ncbi:unnamed protein product [Chondrus crispus]|uniref:Chromo domain-containing protein n=1 Tax=Chondrus crispus TaxID=2769 RepID=S0F3I2_CHOCR|nr:unnamed protein product [Chondrus crispus]CDF77419.1 unnamed protein product [Chondrus crispus]|eukprot:XP_005712293.1 unnamed protein product [Chondrus crispus]
MDITGTRKEGIWIQVQWLGLPDRRDWTWQPLKELFEDVPDMVREFLDATRRIVSQERQRQN